LQEIYKYKPLLALLVATVPDC